RRPLLLRLEHTHRPTLEDYVHRATRLGSSRSLNLRIGIRGRPKKKSNSESRISRIAHKTTIGLGRTWRIQGRGVEENSEDPKMRPRLHLTYAKFEQFLERFFRPKLRFQGDSRQKRLVFQGSR